MTISGRQKHDLENQIRDILTELLSDFGIEVIPSAGDANTLISTEITRRTNDIVSLFVDNPDNHGKLGIVRGYIRMIRDFYSYVPEGTTERVSKAGDQARFGTLQELLGATKLVMNGHNVLRPPICKFEDKDEKFYCMRVVGYGFEYCYDHWQIVQEREKNGQAVSS
jgi:hypothetical protein